MTMTHETEEYCELLESYREYILHCLIRFIKQENFAFLSSGFRSDLTEWIVPITEMLKGTAKSTGLGVSELNSADGYMKNEAAHSYLSCVLQKLNEKLVPPETFAVLKYFRWSHLDAIRRSRCDLILKNKFSVFTNHCFDSIELGLVNEWTSFHKGAAGQDFSSSGYGSSNEKELLQIVFENLFMPIILLDEANRILYFNRITLQFFDLITGVVLDHNSFKELYPQISTFMKSDKKEIYSEIDIETKIGLRYFKVFLKKLVNSEGISLGSFMTFQDLTRNHSAVLNLQAEKCKAEEADKLKTTFLANMSHEIRTPMNAIIGFTELLLHKKNSKVHQQEFLNLIHKSGKNLLHIIEDIIDIAKMESKQFKIKYKVCRPFEVLNELRAVFNEMLRKYGTDHDVELILNVGKDDQNISVYTDGERLKQVVSNLLSNAVKFTNKGFIEYGYRSDESSGLFFFVRDSGMGIPDQMKNKIFDRFFQVEEHKKLNTGGTGLGLAICKNIINLMGGTIKVESKVGEGSGFYFDIPFRKVPIHCIEKKKETIRETENRYPSWQGKVILIAEDDEINFMYLREILKKTGVIILHAVNGLKAIDIAETHEKIDLILMDIKMPEVDGIEATRYISTIRPQIPIIAQTAYALSGDKAKCINAGCCAYITKPVEMWKLLEIVEKYIPAGNFKNSDFFIKQKQ